MKEEGKLWWIADNCDEVQTFKNLIEGNKGVVEKIEPRAGQFDIVFRINRERAVGLSWASGVDSDNWLE